jgi:hypothetical protein
MDVAIRPQVAFLPLAVVLREQMKLHSNKRVQTLLGSVA